MSLKLVLVSFPFPFPISIPIPIPISHPCPYPHPHPHPHHHHPYSLSFLMKNALSGLLKNWASNFCGKNKLSEEKRLRQVGFKERCSEKPPTRVDGVALTMYSSAPIKIKRSRHLTLSLTGGGLLAPHFLKGL